MKDPTQIFRNSRNIPMFLKTKSIYYVCEPKNLYFRRWLSHCEEFLIISWVVALLNTEYFSLNPIVPVRLKIVWFWHAQKCTFVFFSWKNRYYLLWNFNFLGPMFFLGRPVLSRTFEWTGPKINKPDSLYIVDQKMGSKSSFRTRLII